MYEFRYLMATLLVGFIFGSIMSGLEFEFVLKVNTVDRNADTSSLPRQPNIISKLEKDQVDDLTRNEEKAEMNCPHERFIRKQLCENCTNEGDALAYSEERVKFAPTSSNGVLFGTSNREAWEIVPSFNGKQLLYKNKYGSKHFTCNMKTKKCKFDGIECFTWHHTGNGHLFCERTACSINSKGDNR